MLPKTSKNFHSQPVDALKCNYAHIIATALQDEIGNSRHAIKRLSRLTGASERTVHNWLSATRGPSSLHLIALARHSPSVNQIIMKLIQQREISEHEIDRDVATVVELLQESLSLLDKHRHSQAVTPIDEGQDDTSL